MLYGNCLDIVRAVIDGRTDAILRMSEYGFDYIEAGVTSIAAASDEVFEKVCRFIVENGVSVPVCNLMFPGDLRLTGEDVDTCAVTAYLRHVFPRLKQIGTNKLVLGSGRSRRLPDGYDCGRGYEEFSALVRDVMVPECQTYSIRIMIEPLRNSSCNFINTLADGMRVVDAVNSPYVKLIADTIHMLSSREPATEISRYAADILHIHVSDYDSVLPEDGYSPELAVLLAELKSSGYDGTVSFEAAAPKSPDGLKKALKMLKETLKR